MRKPYTTGEIRPYADDTGCDIMMPVGSPVIAVGSGMVIYSEGLPGQGRPHTPWIKSEEHPDDTPGGILIRLDRPLMWESRSWMFAFYLHLSRLAFVVRDGIDAPRRVSEGMMIGHSGSGRSVPHLHFSMKRARSEGLGDFIPPFEMGKILVSWK